MTYVEGDRDAKHCAFVICEGQRGFWIWRVGHHQRDDGRKAVGHVGQKASAIGPGGFDVTMKRFRYSLYRSAGIS